MMHITILRNAVVVERFTMTPQADHGTLWTEIRRRMFHKLTKAEQFKMINQPRTDKYPWSFFNQKGFKISVKPSSTG